MFLPHVFKNGGGMMFFKGPLRIKKVMLCKNGFALLG